jgi:hypothetical protein
MRLAAVLFGVSGIAFIGIGIGDGIVAAVLLGVAMLGIAWVQRWQIRNAPHV